ncbi:hypothetical protein JY651_16565 [Pyxidicoccus parkwayensis]|uniref:Uncharacterized protein n=1 Tax=Pyxidicoccus parkwayensis TaxID=2813578 RepID=A0ABX7P7I1_9BACT|nr:hypothetical protein [Pyxidicoccus parkwaysis]QSQ26440.1 hypothetical protein JY651_16565 [Pyxidicoccus parkwaysis]
MGVPSTNSPSSSSALAAQEAARRAAEEAARRAAEAAARRAAEEAAKRAAAEAALREATSSARGQSRFEPGSARPQGPAMDAQQAAPSSSLLTEDTRDAQANCLDQAADWLNNTTPELRARSELVFLKDNRPGAEGQSGHVVVRQGERVLDPTTNQSYANTQEYLKANPQYQPVGTLSGSKAAKIFSTEPGSPERQKALNDAKVSPELQKMMVADPGGSATTKRSLDSESVATANKDYDTLRKGDPNNYHLAVTQMLNAHPDDKDYQAQLINRLKEDTTGGAVLNQVLKSQYTVNAETGGLGSTDEARAKLIGAMNAAIEAGTLTEAEINQLSRGDMREIWQAIAPQLGVRVSDVNGTVEPLKAQAAKVDETQRAVEAKEQELAEQLASFGPALTEDQRKAYVKAFQDDPKNKKTYEDHQSALNKLSELVGTDTKALHAAAQSSPEEAKAIAHSLALLGNSPDHAQQTLSLAAELGRIDPNSKLLTEPETKKAVSDAVNQRALKLMMESDNPQAGLDTLLKELEPLKISTELFKGINDTKGALGELKEGNFNFVKNLAEGAKDPVSRGVARALIGFGALAAYNESQQKGDDYQKKMLKELGGASSELSNLVAESAASAAESGKWLKMSVNTVGAEKVAKFAGRLAPAMGLGVSILSYDLHKKANEENGNVGLRMAMAGDIISGAGAVLECIPVTAPVGALFSGVGTAISAAGELIDWFLKRGEVKDDQRKYLEAAGVSKELINAMSDADKEHVKLLVEDMGIPADRLQSVLSASPWLLNEEGPGVEGLAALMKHRGIHGPAAADFLEKMQKAGSAEDMRRAVNHFGTAVQHFADPTRPLSEITPETWKAIINLAVQDGAGNPALDALSKG